MNWTDQTGRRWRIRDMGADHLVNSALYLIRKAEDSRAAHLGLFALVPPFEADSEAGNALGEAFDRVMARPLDLPPVFWALRRESERRGLNLDEIDRRLTKGELTHATK